MTKKYIVLAAISVLLMVLGFVFFTQIQPSLKPQPTNEAFVSAITKKLPDFAEGNEPLIAIDSVSRHNFNWYIVTIRSTSEVKKFVPVRLVMVNKNDQLSVLLGPAIRFTEADLTSHNLPDSLVAELTK